MERIPKLTMYEGFHHSVPSRKSPSSENMPPKALEQVVEKDLGPEKQQIWIVDYITIKDIYRVRKGPKKKTIKKKYNKTKLTCYGYSI